MNQNINTPFLNGGGFKLGFIGFMFGAVGLCFTGLALADSAIVEPIADQSNAEFEIVSGVGEHADTVSDINLAAIMGMGAEATKLENGDTLAVLLWDERGNGNKRISGHEVNSGQSYQAVNLTVNRR